MTAPGWINWTGGECPLDETVIVAEVLLRSGHKIFDVAASVLDWSHHTDTSPRHRFDVVAYRMGDA